MSSPLSSVPSNLTRMQYSDNAGIRSNSYLSTGPDDLTVPILQACVDLLPLIGAHNIHDDIMECRTDQQLRQLASSIHTGLLVPMLSRGSTPHVSLSPRFNAEHDVEELAASIEGVCTRTDQTWLKRVCLERDGGRCVVTRSYDVREIMKLPSSERNLHSSCPTEAAHIIPFSLGNSVSNQASRVWDTMYRCFPRIRASLAFGPENINDPSNAMTMWSSIHEMFGSFKLSFESTETENTYRIKTYPGFGTILNAHLPPNGLLALTAHSGLYPLPNPILLELHDAIAKILNATGMSEIVQTLRREQETIRGLANDGSTNIERLLLVF